MPPPLKPANPQPYSSDATNPGTPAKNRFNQKMHDWTNRWDGYELGTLPRKAHQEADAIHAEYEAAIEAERQRVIAANQKKQRLDPDANVNVRYR